MPAKGSLVADQVPIAVVICEYPLPVDSDFDINSLPPLSDIQPEYRPLRSTRVLTEGLGSVPTDLSHHSTSAMTTCPGGAALTSGGSISEGSDFQVALMYPSGTIWITDSTGPLTCSRAMSAGGYSTGSYAELFAAALTSGAWNSDEIEFASCPEQVDSTPFEGAHALPRPTIDTGGKLVPADLPTTVALCSYGLIQTGGGTYHGGGKIASYELHGDFTALVADLRQGQSIRGGLMSCPASLREPTPQLMGLTYGSGSIGKTIWVNAPLDDNCGLASNGSTWMLGGHAPRFAEALAGKPWAGVTAVAVQEPVATPLPSGPAAPLDPSSSSAASGTGAATTLLPSFATSIQPPLDPSSGATPAPNSSVAQIAESPQQVPSAGG